MDRRELLNNAVVGLAIGLSGCQRSKNPASTTTKRDKEVMDLFPEVKKVPDGWRLEVMVVNEYPRLAPIYDVHLFAYDSDRNNVCEAHVGDLPSSGDTDRTITTTCSEFPAIVTATARETPCENALIPIVYWTGTDAQKTATIASDQIVWKAVYRKCGEDLPPQRVLDKVETASAEQEQKSRRDRKRAIRRRG